MLVVGCVLATYVGWFMGKDPSKLEIMIPALVAAYTIPNVIGDWVWRKWGGPQPTESSTKNTVVEPTVVVTVPETGKNDGTDGSISSGYDGSK